MAQYKMLVALLALLLVSCTTTPVYKGVAVANASGYGLGVVVDDALQVVEIAPGSAAEKAGVQVGDRLVSLTWILSEAPEEVPTSQATKPITTTLVTTRTSTFTPKRPPAGVETKTVQFTDGEAIRLLTSYAVPLQIHLIRQGQELELTIIPTPFAVPASDSTTAVGTDSF